MQALALAADGTIVVAGDAGGEMAAARLDAAGKLITTFGTNGVRVVAGHPAEHELATGLALAPDGRIVLGGWRHAAASNVDVAVARLGTDGTLDPSFGTGGIRTAPFAPAAHRDLVRAIALQPQAGGGVRAVVAGAALTPGAKMFVTRFE